MFVPHIKITPSHKRVIGIGDIHGNLDALLKLLEKLSYNPNTDLLISLGDIIDRGEHSLATLTYFLDNPNVLVAAGNHEEMMANAVLSDKNQAGHRMFWEDHGGIWSKSCDKTILLSAAKKMREQFYYAITLELPCGTRFGLTHANVTGETWEEEQFKNSGKNELSELIWTNSRAKKKPTACYDIRGVDYTIHGHTPKKQPDKFMNSLFIDTGSGMTGGKLTAIDITKFARKKDLSKACVSVQAN